MEVCDIREEKTSVREEDRGKYYTSVLQKYERKVDKILELYQNEKISCFEAFNLSSDALEAIKAEIPKPYRPFLSRKLSDLMMRKLGKANVIAKMLVSH